ncbi:tRNA pseudouridine synthase [Gracilaria domingensis]|nr:tRNA pseudouridine synthase [Gracilaria domingensis]
MRVIRHSFARSPHRHASRLLPSPPSSPIKMPFICVPPLRLRLPRLRTTATLTGPSSQRHPTRPPSALRSRQHTKRKVALLLAYDGALYHGLQRNHGVLTISDVLETALYKASAISSCNVGDLNKVQWQVAARTDRGVSAAANVVSAKLMFCRDELCAGDALQRTEQRVRSFLPAHVNLYAISRVTGSFSARASCSHRSYQYMLPLSALGGTSLETFDHILRQFKGTHYFHNYTVGSDHCVPPRSQARRYVMQCACDQTPIRASLPSLSKPVEWITIHVMGQSFMLHQIRKMVSLALMTALNRVPQDSISRSFRPDTYINIPPAPAAGLFLNSCYFDWYNRRHGSALEQPLSLAQFDQQRELFKEQFILPSIAKREVEEDTMGVYFRTIEAHPTTF